VTRQGVNVVEPGVEYRVIDSNLADLSPLDALAPRELEVLTLVGQRSPIKAIAEELGVAQRTVELYRSDISRKLGLHLSQRSRDLCSWLALRLLTPTCRGSIAGKASRSSVSI
jgi:DNA-binding NarL/FixJ family response regulator